MCIMFILFFYLYIFLSLLPDDKTSPSVNAERGSTEVEALWVYFVITLAVEQSVNIRIHHALLYSASRSRNVSGTDAGLLSRLLVAPGGRAATGEIWRRRFLGSNFRQQARMLHSERQMDAEAFKHHHSWESGITLNRSDENEQINLF